MQIPFFTQALGFAGAMLILAAYIAHQAGWMDSRRAFYNALNVLGAGILTAVALNPFQLGFFVLESVWTAVSLFALWRALRTPGGGQVSP